MTKEQIQAKIVQLMKEINERRREIWMLTKRRDKMDSSKGDSDD